MKNYSKYVILFALAAGLTACATEAPDTSSPEEPDTEQEVDEQELETSEDPGEMEDQEPTVPEDEETDTIEFDEQIEETIEIEGMEEPITLNLYDNPDAPFLTYVPDDFVVEEVSGGEGESYVFYANYEGEKNEDINLEIYFFADHITEEPSLDDEDSTFSMLLEGMEEVPAEEEWHNWSIQEYYSEDRSNHALLGEHEGQYFVMVVNSTPLYSEGFIPRVDKVISHFYWTDTNDYLVQE